MKHQRRQKLHAALGVVGSRLCSPVVQRSCESVRCPNSRRTSTSWKPLHSVQASRYPSDWMHGLVTRFRSSGPTTPVMGSLAPLSFLELLLPLCWHSWMSPSSFCFGSSAMIRVPASTWTAFDVPPPGSPYPEAQAIDYYCKQSPTVSSGEAHNLSKIQSCTNSISCIVVFWIKL